MLADARPAAFLALLSYAVVLADARPAAFLALASYAVVLADARPAAFLAPASYAVVRALFVAIARSCSMLLFLLVVALPGRGTLSLPRSLFRWSSLLVRSLVCLLTHSLLTLCLPSRTLDRPTLAERPASDSAITTESAKREERDAQFARRCRCRHMKVLRQLKRVLCSRSLSVDRSRPLPLVLKTFVPCVCPFLSLAFELLVARPTSKATFLTHFPTSTPKTVLSIIRFFSPAFVLLSSVSETGLSMQRLVVEKVEAIV